MATKHKANPQPHVPKKLTPEVVTDLALFPVQFRNLALAEAVKTGMDREDADRLLSLVGDADICELGEAYGVNDAFAAAHVAFDVGGHAEPDENAVEGERQPMKGPLQNILARLAAIDPEVKKKLVDALLKLVGIIL